MSSKTYRVAHILVAARHEADDLLAKLKSGSDFAELAKKFSNCASAKNGGDLGDLRIGQADSDFEEAALEVKPGETAKSYVRTKFGYHLIKRLK